MQQLLKVIKAIDKDKRYGSDKPSKRAKIRTCVGYKYINILVIILDIITQI